MSSDPQGSSRNRHVSLSDEDAVKEIVAGAVLDLWRAVNNLTRLRPSKRERYRVAIFGSARAQPGSHGPWRRSRLSPLPPWRFRLYVSCTTARLSRS